MTLKNLAEIYENQLLSKLYFIVEKENVYIINSSKQNFMHLTGLQRSREFENFPKVNFFDLCKNDCREVSELSFKSISDRNIARIKTDNFSYIQDALTSIKSIYLDKNIQILTCSTDIKYKNSDKFFSISFLQDNSKPQFYVPFTLQVDQSLEQSNYIKPENLAQIYESLTSEKKDIFKIIKTHNKTIEDIRMYVLEKYHPLAKEILRDLVKEKQSVQLKLAKIKDNNEHDKSVHNPIRKHYSFTEEK